MPIDRAATLRNAEKLLRQGKLEPAIAEYLRLVEEQPRDFNAANVLGDLYARAGRGDQAIAQFIRIADSLFEEGFTSKAAAVYKKILKLAPDHEHAQLQAAEIAAAQGLLTDARAYFAAVESQRRARGDGLGATQVRVRCANLDPTDYGARREAAAARAEIGDVEGAVRDLKEIAADLVTAGRPADAIEVLTDAARVAPGDPSIGAQIFEMHVAAEDFPAARAAATTVAQLRTVADLLDLHARYDEALDVLCEVARRSPEDLELRTHLARQFVGRGNVAAAAEYLTVEAAGDDPKLLTVAAEIELGAGRVEPGLAIVDRLLAGNLVERAAIVQLAGALAQRAPDAGFAVASRVVSAAVATQDWAGAAGALEAFIAGAPHHIPALLQLVEIAVDGGLDPVLQTSQARLADAYLATGMPSEARFIAEDLVAREPWDAAHIERFRRALVLLNEPDPDAIIAERLSGQSPFGNTGLTDEEMASIELPAVPARGHAIDIERLLNELDPPAPPPTARARSESVEVDLSIVLDRLDPASRAVAPQPPPILATDLDGVFEQLRSEADRRAALDTAEQDYRRALELYASGDLDACMTALEAASRAPKLRFVTASRLGRLYRDRGVPLQAIEWFESAAQAPAPAPEDYHELLLDLAGQLEIVGESARALAICLELQADAGSYRDVEERVDRLAKAQARG